MSDTTWTFEGQSPDPTAHYVRDFLRNAEGAAIHPTGLTAARYVDLVEANVGYFAKHQDEHGAIIDPYRKIEWQYATPSFALGAIFCVITRGRDDLLEPAAKAMDWATTCLNKREVPQQHEDFYAPLLAHALPLLNGRVSEARYSMWRERLVFDPREIYRDRPGGGNWNVVALSGDYLLFKQGLREDDSYTRECLAAQGRHFANPLGLYCEGPMPYDHFPRIWAADMLTAGYAGEHADDLAEMLRRAALASLFMQSPLGELPAGGRSAHHQWNEAEQCVTYEIFAAKSKQEGNLPLARAYKRAARLALQSMTRWQRPSGELWVMKNKVDPSEQFAFEHYTSHSQYNLLAMAMLVIAHEHAQSTEDVPEGPAPADIGGFVFETGLPFGKVFANAGGAYIEIETQSDPDHNPEGLLRIHFKDGDPQIGPSDGLTAAPRYLLPDAGRVSVAVGVAWHDRLGAWRSVAEYDRGRIREVEVERLRESPEEVRFDVKYRADFDGPAEVIEHYCVTPEAVHVQYEVTSYNGPLRLQWPVLADNGQEKTEIFVADHIVTVRLGGKEQVFRVAGADSVVVGEERHPGRNGWSRLAIADNTKGNTLTLTVEI